MNGTLLPLKQGWYETGTVRRQVITDEIIGGYNYELRCLLQLAICLCKVFTDAALRCSLISLQGLWTSHSWIEKWFEVCFILPNKCVNRKIVPNTQSHANAAIIADKLSINCEYWLQAGPEETSGITLHEVESECKTVIYCHTPSFPFCHCYCDKRFIEWCNILLTHQNDVQVILFLYNRIMYM